MSKGRHKNESVQCNIPICSSVILHIMNCELFSLSAVKTQRGKTLHRPLLELLHALLWYLWYHLSSHELRVETEFSQVQNCSCLFYQQCVPYFPMKYYSRQEILPREQGDNWMSINDLQVHICYNTNTGGGNWEQALMTSLMLPQITPWSSTMYGSGKRYKIMSKWE